MVDHRMRPELIDGDLAFYFKSGLLVLAFDGNTFPEI